jgi:tol-pal system protein YbgF
VTRDAKMALTFALVSTLLGGCAGFTVLTTGIAGAIYVKSQTVERTFVAPMPEVTAACRHALGQMGFTIEREEIRETGRHILATASSDYEIEVTITPVTAEATKVSINADSLPERDKATGTEIFNQMTTVLSPTPPVHLSALPTPETVPPRQTVQAAPAPPPMLPSVAHQPPIDDEPSATPAVTGEDPSTELRAGPSTQLTASPTAELRAGPSTQLRAGRAPREMPKREATANGQLIYDTAIHDYIEGDFPAAIAHFQIYLATYADGTERPGALYWLGESLYSQHEYTDALVQFEAILLEYPQSPEAVRALLKGAQAYRQLGETRQATTLLQMLITEHPHSREAQIAQSLRAKW